MLEQGVSQDNPDRDRPSSRARSLRGLVLRMGILVAVAAALVLISRPGGNGPVSAKVVGPEQPVFIWTRDACERLDLPDAPARAFRDASGQVQLIAASSVNRAM